VQLRGKLRSINVVGIGSGFGASMVLDASSQELPLRLRARPDTQAVETLLLSSGSAFAEVVYEP
jgi:hypothetical protein